MTIERNLKALALAGLLTAVPVLGSAATVTLTNTTSGDSFGSYGRAGVNVTSTSPATSYNGTGGAFDLTSSGGGFGRIVAFCVDLLQGLGLPGQYETSATPGSFNVARASDLESLFETAFSTLDLADNTQAAGFQLAVWEIAFETGGFDLSDGSFQSAASDATTFGQDLLEGLGGPITQSYELTYFLSDTLQDVVTVSEVPLPAAGVLLLAALGGLGLARRRQTV